MMEKQGKEVALCLSGGGYRAALFHLGSLRRLNELGILSQVDVISCVSGGSMLAAHLATHIRAATQRGIPWPVAGERWTAFDVMASSLHAKLAEALALMLFPSFGEVLVRKMPRGFKNWVGEMRLENLPERPDIVFNATELRTGRLWSFSRTKLGSDALGYSHKYGHALVAEAVAASACFPAFDPLRVRFRAADFDIRTEATPQGDWEVLFTDGGVFDNLGIEKVSKAGTLLISNGGRRAGPLPEVMPAGSVDPAVESAQLERPAPNQLEALKWILGTRDPGPAQYRLAELSRRFAAQEIDGAYWSIGDGIDTGKTQLTEGYTQDLAVTFIATIRTQLDAFSDAERYILENHGYLMTEAAIRTQAPALARSTAPLAPPWPDALGHDFVRKHLRSSSNISSGLRKLRNPFLRRD